MIDLIGNLKGHLWSLVPELTLYNFTTHHDPIELIDKLCLRCSLYYQIVPKVFMVLYYFTAHTCTLD